jgi:ligand-binding sensor domain-containing protein
VTKTQGRRQSLGILGLLLPSLLFVCPCAVALNPALDVSQYAHTAWKMRDGFVKGPIEAIAQTPDGYLWLGTDYGLMRFDGVRAVPWQPPPNQSLPSTYIAGLLASRDGTLWIGTLKGLASWKDGKLTLYPDAGERPIFRMVEDREGTVWAGELAFPHSGTLCAIGHGGVRCYGGDGTFGPGVFGLFEDHKGNLWVGVKDGVWRWNAGSAKFFSLPGNVNGIQCLGEDADGALLVGWKGGLYELIEGGTKRYSLQGSVPKFGGLSLVRDRDGSIWIPTPRKGVVHINQRRVDTFSLNDGLSSDFATTIFEDREGNIWAGTTAGLDRFHDLAVATFSVKQGLSSSTVVSVLADADGGVWVGTFEGLNRVKNGQVMIGETGGGKRDGKINGQNPHSIFQDGRGRVWITTKREVGYLEGGRFVSALSFPDDQTLAIAGDKMGNLWVGHQEQGLSRIPPQGEVKRMPWADLVHKDDAVTLAVDPSRGGLWLGFVRSGIAYLENGRIQASYGVAEGLGQGTVSRFRFDPDGTVWIGTDGGLSRLKNGRIATLTSKNGLPCDLVRWVIQDDDHSFWLSMPCGLVRILRRDVDAWAGAIDKNGDTAKAVQFTVFDVSDGVQVFPDTTGYSPRVARTPDGKLWFPAVDGVSVIDPNHLPFNKRPPPVHIEQVIADRESYYGSASSVSLDANGGVRLPAQTRDLRIDYTALSLVAAEKVLFKYKLEGFDKDWQNAGTRRQAFYTNLPPKNYTFRVKACNNSGVWNEAGAFLDFSVAPAYYQTIWFRLSCVAALLALVWGLYQLRLQQLAREFNMRLDERVSERTRIARELHDSLLQGV